RGALVPGVHGLAAEVEEPRRDLEGRVFVVVERRPGKRAGGEIPRRLAHDVAFAVDFTAAGAAAAGAVGLVPFEVVGLAGLSLRPVDVADRGAVGAGVAVSAAVGVL